MLPADVRALPRDEQLIFVAGAKPIRAKKVRFDQEPIFAQRLRPPAPRAEIIPPQHDWLGVRALGRLAPDPKPRATARPERRAALRPPPPMPAPSAQPDLFGAQHQSHAAISEAPKPQKISEIALAGLRSAASTPAVAPAPPATPDVQPPPKRRATGV